VLVRKVYGDHNRRHKSRNWKLQQLNKEIEEDMNVESYDKYVLLCCRLEISVDIKHFLQSKSN